jgi:mercuric ion transport protein
MPASGFGAAADTTAAAGVPAPGRGEVGRQRLAAVGGILAALGAASCCVVPFALFTLASAELGSAT